MQHSNVEPVFGVPKTKSPLYSNTYTPAIPSWSQGWFVPPPSLHLQVHCTVGFIHPDQEPQLTSMRQARSRNLQCLSPYACHAGDMGPRDAPPHPHPTAQDPKPYPPSHPKPCGHWLRLAAHRTTSSSSNICIRVSHKHIIGLLLLVIISSSCCKQCKDAALLAIAAAGASATAFPQPATHTRHVLETSLHHHMTHLDPTPFLAFIATKR